jgi:hypothetical protein
MDIEDYAPGGAMWPKAYDAGLVTDPGSNLYAYLGPSSKRVVFSDYLPAGHMIVTEREIIITHAGWEKLVAFLKRQQECRDAVRRIVERELAAELAWLRGAGHAV